MTLTQMKYKDVPVGGYFVFQNETFIMSSITKNFVVPDKETKQMNSMEVHYAINIITGEFLDPFKYGDNELQWLTLNAAEVTLVEDNMS